MDQIKDSFQRVKNDIDSIREEINLLKQFLYENNKQFSELSEIIKELSSKLINFKQETSPAPNLQNPAVPAYNPTNPADKLPFKPLKEQNIGFSIGNEGVPADRQTNQQTNQQTKNPSLTESLSVLDSLDHLKKEIRNKFKRITDQEFLVFSTIYQIEEENGYSDYKGLSQKLNLTESSIRDYVGKLIKKGIPIEKIKINNKMIQLSVSENLKKIAPLPVIFQLREL